MITEWINKLVALCGGLGYWGVFVSSVGIAPAEVVIAMTGASKPGNLIEIAVAAGLGEAIGAIPMYLIGCFFSKQDIFKFLNGKGKFLNISEESYDHEHRSIVKYGSLYIIVSRFIPGVRIVSSLVAGFVKQNFVNFFVSVFIGSFAYGYLFAFIGAEVELNIGQIEKITNTMNGVAVIIVIVLVPLYFKYRRKIMRYVNGEKNISKK